MSNQDHDREFKEVLAAIQAFRLERSGRWRVPQDAVDAVIEKLEDRAMGGDLKGALAWSRVVYRNLLKSGPDSVGLSSERHAAHIRAIDTSLSVFPQPDDADERSPWRERLLEFLPKLRSRLTPAERDTLEWTLHGLSLRETARRCGGSPRNARTRLERIVAKARGLIADETHEQSRDRTGNVM